MKRWPLNKSYFWERAPFFRILLPFVAGIVAYDTSWLHGVSISVMLTAGGSALALYAGTHFLIKHKPLFNTLSFIALQVFLLFSGFSISYFNDIRNDRNWFGNNTHTVSLARITDIPAEKERSWKVPVKIISNGRDSKVMAATGTAFLYLYKDMPMMLHKGDTILLPANWQPIKNAGNPYEFDYAAYCRRNNVFYQQTSSPKDIRLYSAADPDHAPLLERSHDWCMQQLDKYVTDQKTKGLLQAMLLGDVINLDEDILHSYSDTGIVHIIAISGGNVAIFFIVISWLLWWLKDKKHMWIKYVIALPLVWFYVMMAGAQPSAIRAAIMFSLLAFGIMLQKNNNSLNQLFATAFLLLCAQPFWLFSVGFQLSFVAVLSLILFYKPVYKWVSPVNKIVQLLWSTVAASIAAEILVAPLVIYYFHTFPLLFIVSNVLAYLFMGLVLILSIAIIALFWWPALATLLGTVTTWIVTIFDKLIVWLQKCSPVSFHFLTLNNIELLLVYIVITGIILFLLNQNKRMLFAGLSACCLLLFSFCGDQWTRLQQQRFIVYNTGKSSQIEIIKGDAYTVLKTDSVEAKKIEYAVKPAHTMLQAWNTDTLPENEVFSINGKTILILNKDINIDQQFPVDYLVINYTSAIDPVKLQRIFSPSLIVIGSNFSRKQQQKLSEICIANHISLHNIADDGAFVR